MAITSTVTGDRFGPDYATFFGDYLISLAAENSAPMLAVIPARVQSTWQGDKTDN